MVKATARLATDRPERYMKAMCKHFAHKVEAGFDETSGFAKLPDGRLTMRVAPGTLHFDVEAEDVQKLLKTRYIVDAHIVRFAFKEQILGLDWTSIDGGRDR